MTREVHWAQTAHADLRRLRGWLQLYAPHKEQEEIKRIASSVTYLQIHPRLGKRLPNLYKGDEELRELLVTPYVIHYIVDKKIVHIARLWHYREHRCSFQ